MTEDNDCTVYEERSIPAKLSAKSALFNFG